ncbi:sigma factor [Streptomyces sp. MBT55]|uniref:sigma factor n=1 Tax=Streptomyces sp. MBT55 TaxID=1488386 RepID=UPI0019145C2B|nr:sigma factor [Streptomyces sp. MBT55]MBK6040797.1 hypothetical protein [Streptomyces sp. MBT55]
MSTTTLSLEDLMARTTPGPAGCALWTGSVSGQGAPVLYTAGKRKQARRLAYELRHEPVGAKQQVAHRATNTVPADVVRLCINPDHAELAEAITQTRTRCDRAGHPFTGDNVLYTSEGNRRCRACDSQYEEARASVRREGRPAREAKPLPPPEAGEQVAAMCAKYRARIVRLLVGEVRGADLHLAEDLAQEVFLSAWMDLGQMRATTEAQVFAWLSTIARRRTFAHYRAKRNTCEYPADTGDWQMANRDLVPSGGYYTPSRSGFRTATIGAAL